MKRMDLNVDAGEGLPWPEEAWAWVTSVNVGAGAHAGSPAESRAFAAEAIARGLTVGVHPGYPDREGFGRRPWREIGGDVWESLRQQCEGWREAGAQYLKPHGAFYHESGQDDPAAEWLEQLLAETGLGLLGSPHNRHAEVAAAAGVVFRAEGFADRGVRPDGLLIPRGEPGAELVTEAEVSAAVARVAPEVQVLCLHTDREGWRERVQWVRAALDMQGYEIQACDWSC
jgi:UPF0271 protein